MPQLSDFYGLIAKKVRMVQTWIDIHAEELVAAWALAVRHLHPTKIRGLDK